MVVVKISADGLGGPCLVVKPEEIWEAIKNNGDIDPGCVYCVEFAEMSEEEFESLGEFDGW